MKRTMRGKRASDQKEPKVSILWLHFQLTEHNMIIFSFYIGISKDYMETDELCMFWYLPCTSQDMKNFAQTSPVH